MAFRNNVGTRNAVAAARVAGMTVAEVRTGAQPASADDAASGTLLATITVAWSTEANGSVSITGTPSATAVATGTAGHVRFRNTGDTKRFDGAVGAEVTMADTNVVTGGTVTLTGATITEPAA